MMIDYTAIGQSIRARRRALRLTQSALSEMVGVTPSFLGHIERGTRVMSVETLMALCPALGCTPNDLLGVEAPPAAAPEPEEVSVPQLLRVMADLLESKREGTS